MGRDWVRRAAYKRPGRDPLPLLPGQDTRKSLRPGPSWPPELRLVASRIGANTFLCL